MMIEIPDTLTAQQRKEMLHAIPVEYAIVKFNGNRTQAANWLGISVRSMREYVRKWDSLQKWRLPPPVMGRYIVRK